MESEYSSALVTSAKAMADQDPETFEDMILHTLDVKHEFHKRVAPALKSTLEPDERNRDFSTLHANVLALVLREFHDNIFDANFMPRITPIICRTLTKALRLASKNVFIGESMDDEVVQLLLRIRNENMDGLEPLAESGIEHWLTKRRINRVISTETQMIDWSPERVVTRIGEEYSASRVETKRTQFSFGEGWLSQALDTTRIPFTSMPKVQEMMRGGFGKKELVIFIGAPSSGKTVLSTQIAKDLALSKVPEDPSQNCKGLLVSTEQEHQELEPRIISSACSIPFSIIADKSNPGALSQTQQDQIKNLFEQLGPSLKIEDYVPRGTATTFMEDVDSLIKKFKDTHGRMDFMVFDWLGGALTEKVAGRPEAVRIILKQAADALGLLARKHDIAIITFVQGKKEECIKAGRYVDQTCVQECKNIDDAATYTFGVSIIPNLAEESSAADNTYKNHQFFCCCKGRKSEAKVLKVTRDFRFQRYRDGHV